VLRRATQITKSGDIKTSGNVVADATIQLGRNRGAA
jgi:hypothetical protein